MANRQPKFQEVWIATMGRLQEQTPVAMEVESKKHAQWMQADFNRWRGWMQERHPGELCAQAEDASCGIRQRPADGKWFLVFQSSREMKRKMLASLGIGRERQAPPVIKSEEDMERLRLNPRYDAYEDVADMIRPSEEPKE